jgi:hypothetical protein
MRRNSLALALVSASALLLTALPGTSNAEPSAGVTAFHQATGVAGSSVADDVTGKKVCTNNLKQGDTGIAVNSQNFEPSLSAYHDFGAEDFRCRRNLRDISITFKGQYFNGTTGPNNTGGPAKSFNISVYANSILPGPTKGEPDDLTPRVVCTHPNVPYTDNTGSSTGPVYTFKVSHLPCKIRRGGTYWLEIQANLDFVDPAGIQDGQWGWEVTSNSVLNPGDWKNPGGGFGTPSYGRVYEDGTNNFYMCDLVATGLSCPLDYMVAVS